MNVIHTHMRIYIYIYIHYSFGMTLWELAYEKIPYAGWNLQKIQEHVISHKREKIIIHYNDPHYVHDYLKIITESK